MVFGWYSFNIKSFSANDLNLNPGEWPNTVFEVRQKVFHIFWIPVFSLGKEYVVRIQDRKYDMPDQIVSKIKWKRKIRTPWYAFLFPILAVLIPVIVGIYINIAEAAMRNNRYHKEQKQYATVVSELQHQLHELKRNNYLRLFNTAKPNSEDIILLKVIDIQDSVYSFQAKSVHHPKSSRDTYYIENYSTDTLRFTKKQLEKAICPDYKIITDKQAYGVSFLGADKYIIDQIEYFDQPVIDGPVDWYFWNTLRQRNFVLYNIHYTGDQRNRLVNFYLELQNFGIPVNLIQIQNLENNLQWTDTLPIKIGAYKYLNKYYIHAITPSHIDSLKFKSKFIFEDSLKNKYEYMITGTGNTYEIKRN